MIRRAVSADGPHIRALQTELDSPCPDLLELALATTETELGPIVLVAYSRDAPASRTPRDAHWERTSTDTGQYATRPPVAYVLFVPDSIGRKSGWVGVGGGRIYVAEMVVAPNRRREGYGTTLLSAIVARTSGETQLSLVVRANDERARSFYKEAGFEVIDELPHYYAEGDTGLLMGRRIRG